MNSTQKLIQDRLLKERQSIQSFLNPADFEPLGQNIVEFWYVTQMKYRLNRIERALTRLENGQYGICNMCHHTITPDRLQVMQETELCLECQSSVEYKHSLPRAMAHFSTPY